MNPKELNQILDAATYIIDSREKDNHVEKYYIENNITYKEQKLLVGDYAIEVDGSIVPFIIERKKNLNEICSNILDRSNLDEHKHNRFYRELDKAKTNGIKLNIFIEDLDYYRKLQRHQYTSRIEPYKLEALLNSMSAKFGVPIIPVASDLIGRYIHYRLRYEARNYLKELHNL